MKIEVPDEAIDKLIISWLKNYRDTVLWCLRQDACEYGEPEMGEETDVSNFRMCNVRRNAISLSAIETLLSDLGEKDDL